MSSSPACEPGTEPALDRIGIGRDRKDPLVPTPFLEPLPVEGNEPRSDVGRGGRARVLGRCCWGSHDGPAGTGEMPTPSLAVRNDPIAVRLSLATGAVSVAVALPRPTC